MGRIGPVPGPSRRVALVVALVIAATLAGSPAPSGAQAAPTLVVTPSTGLVEGQEVELAGTGLLPSTTAYVVVCPPGVTDGFACDFGGSLPPSTTTDATGSFALSFTVRRFVTGVVGGVPTGFDCAVVTCSIACLLYTSDAADEL